MGYIKSDFKRCFTSPWFFISVIGIIISYFLGDWGDLKYNLATQDVLSFMDISSHIGYFSELTILLSALPYAMSFSEDWNSQFIKSLIIRGGVFKYAVSKIITCIVSAITAILLGTSMLIVILATRIPLVSTISTNYKTFTEGTFGFLLVSGNHIMYFVIQIFFVAIICSVFALVGLVVTTYLPNKFLAITVPIISYFTFLQVGIALGLPAFLKVDKIMKGQFILGEPYMNILYVLALGLIMYIIASYIFYRMVKRNVEE